MARKIECHLPAHEGEWIERVDRVTVSKWNEWKTADYKKTLELLDYFIIDWKLEDIEGNLVTLKPFTRTLDYLDVVFIRWTVRVITDSIADDMVLPPNSFGPSQTEPKVGKTATDKSLESSQN